MGSAYRKYVRALSGIALSSFAYQKAVHASALDVMKASGETSVSAISSFSKVTSSATSYLLGRMGDPQKILRAPIPTSVYGPLKPFYQMANLTQATCVAGVSAITNLSNGLGNLGVSVISNSLKCVASSLPRPQKLDTSSVGGKVLGVAAMATLLMAPTLSILLGNVGSQALAFAMTPGVLQSLMRWQVMYFAGKKTQEFFSAHPNVSIALASGLILWGGYELVENATLFASVLLKSMMPTALSEGAVMSTFGSAEIALRQWGGGTIFLKPAAKIALKGFRNALSSASLSLCKGNSWEKLREDVRSGFSSGLSKGLYPLMQKEFLKSFSPMTKNWIISPERAFIGLSFVKKLSESTKHTLSSDVPQATKEMADFLSAELIDLFVDGGLSLDAWKNIDKLLTAVGVLSPFLKELVHHNYMIFLGKNTSAAGAASAKE